MTGLRAGLVATSGLIRFVAEKFLDAFNMTGRLGSMRGAATPVGVRPDLRSSLSA